jgi:Tol biopolymer transport system component
MAIDPKPERKPSFVPSSPWQTAVRLKRSSILAGESRRQISGAIVAAVLAVLLIAPAARADQLAYNCGYDICVINPDNPAEHSNLTETSEVNGVEQSPAWSPDGHWIAYTGEYAGANSHYELYVIDATKSAAEAEAVNLSENSDAQPDWEEPPRWSPDGSLIAYEETYFTGPLEHQSHVFVSPFDGSADQVPIGSLDASGQGIHPSWTPGERVVFGRARSIPAIPAAPTSRLSSGKASTRSSLRTANTSRRSTARTSSSTKRTARARRR